MVRRSGVSSSDGSFDAAHRAVRTGGNAMKSTVMTAGLIALACSSLPAFAKVQGTGLAIADVTLAHAKAEHGDRAIDAERNLASHRADRSSTQSHQG